MRLAWATKGFEQRSGKLPHEVATEVLGERWPIAVLSGPTFAREVGAGLPTAMTVASPDEGFAAAIARNISGLNFRAYTSNDVIGVEVGGAVKNVLAIGAGIADGMGYGANTRIALITRGLAEMTRLGEALGRGAKRSWASRASAIWYSPAPTISRETDASGSHSRWGQSVEAALAGIHQVVEGYSAAKAVHEVAKRMKIEMPICEAAYRVLYAGLPIKDAVQALMAREIRRSTTRTSDGLWPPDISNPA